MSALSQLINGVKGVQVQNTVRSKEQQCHATKVMSSGEENRRHVVTVTSTLQVSDLQCACNVCSH